MERRSLQDEEQTILFRLSTLFNPVILFCIFLSEVIFIKHTHKGISCAMFHVGLVQSLMQILNATHLCFFIASCITIIKSFLITLYLKTSELAVQNTCLG